MADEEKYLEKPSEPLSLGDTKGRWRRHHVFEDADVRAVNAALAAQRPLLLRGKPGTGKSQLALAAAVGLGRAFVSVVVDARTESRDLLWNFDAVGRLADAQIGSFKQLVKQNSEGQEEVVEESEQEKNPTIRELLRRERYTSPGPLWWAFDWVGAVGQAKLTETDSPPQREGANPGKGVVVLLDEIDKADSSVPNGLLGVLGDGEFSVPQVGTVSCTGVEPLVVITTNEERALPDAFLRRCVVHELKLPKDQKILTHRLVRLGEAHFVGVKGADWPEPTPGSLRLAAKMLHDDRQLCLQESLSPPGVAEYLDLLRVAVARAKTPKDIDGRLGKARQFLLRKHPGLPPVSPEDNADSSSVAALSESSD
ncbi:MAG: MoxR family ATPase [Acidobacteriota bacterium]